MANNIEYFLLSLSTLFTLINPVGIAPIFLTLTERFSEKEQKSIAKKGVLTGLVVLLAFAYLGSYIFALYSHYSSIISAKRSCARSSTG